MIRLSSSVRTRVLFYLYVVCWSEERWAGIETVHISRHKNTTCFSGASTDSLCVFIPGFGHSSYKRNLKTSTGLLIAKLEASLGLRAGFA
jgi:hypothetical protein